jgi:flagella synthesis protein FlgN
MSGLLAPLGDLLVGLDNLHATLTEETEALRRGNADDLPRLTQGKAPQLALINQLWAVLTQSAGLGSTATAAALAARIAQLADSESLKLWSRVEARAREVDRQNRLNGELIQEQLRHAQAALRVLQDAANRGGLYGADGQSLTMFTGQRTIDEV